MFRMFSYIIYAEVFHVKVVGSAAVSSLFNIYMCIIDVNMSLVRKIQAILHLSLRKIKKDLRCQIRYISHY